MLNFSWGPPPNKPVGMGGGVQPELGSYPGPFSLHFLPSLSFSPFFHLKKIRKEHEKWDKAWGNEVSWNHRNDRQIVCWCLNHGSASFIRFVKQDRIAALNGSKTCKSQRVHLDRLQMKMFITFSLLGNLKLCLVWECDLASSSTYLSYFEILELLFWRKHLVG